MRRVIWSDAALADLRSLRSYLAETYDPEVSQEVIRQLVVGGRFLLAYPGAGVALSYGTWRKWRPKKTRYILIYRAVRDGIEIARVRHAQENWRADT